MAELKGKGPDAGALFDAAMTAGAKPSNINAKPLVDKLPATDPRIGTKIGNYVIIDKIGGGAYGNVYLAENPLIKKRVAIKILSEKFSDETTTKRFLQEAQLLVKIKHTNVVEAMDFGTTEDGRPYILMELVEGNTLRAVLDFEKISLEKKIDIISQICMGLAAAHKQGIIHRDMKPENVMLIGKNYSQVKILDFGIAKATEEQSQDLTQEGDLFGTPKYMSPEQTRGEPGIDHRSDIFSVGVILYEMVCGKPPFKKENTYATFTSIQKDQVILPSLMDSTLPPDIDGIILMALDKDKKMRFRDMEEFLSALESIGKKNGGAQTIGTTPPTIANIGKPDGMLPQVIPTRKPAITDPLAGPTDQTVALDAKAKKGDGKAGDTSEAKGSDIKIAEKEDSRGGLQIKMTKDNQTIYELERKGRGEKKKNPKPESKYKKEIEAAALGTVISGTIVCMHPGVYGTIKAYLSRLPLIGGHLGSIDIPQQIAAFGHSIDASYLVAGAATLTAALTTLFVLTGIEDKKKGENK